MTSERNAGERGQATATKTDRGSADASAPRWRWTVVPTRAQAWHALLSRNGFYPVAACSVLAVGMLVARVSMIGAGRGFLFMIWNLFLAWLPYAFALPLAALPSRRGHAWKLLPLFGAWLLFLPNAPYMMTDLLHLRTASGAPSWYDGAMLFVFAWTGCLLGFHSLAIVHRRVEAWLGGLAGWTFVLAASLLSGFGIYLGRFLRWNSWNVVTRPRALMEDVLDMLLRPAAHPKAWAVTLLFGAFLLAAYGTFRAPTPRLTAADR